MSSECPTCGKDDFKTTRGMRHHHSVVHGEKLVEYEYECQECGDNFEGHPNNKNKYCSRECMSKCYKGEFVGKRFKSENNNGEEHPRYQERVQKSCPVCNEEFTVTQSETSKYCSRECSDKGRLVDRKRIECFNCSKHFKVREGSNRKYCSSDCAVENREKKVVKECKNCGEDVVTIPSVNRIFCSRQCRGEAHTGENSPHWKGGWESYYGSTWTRNLKESIRKRDNKQCQYCSKNQKDHWRRLPVHHIIPFRKFGVKNHQEANKKSNLITLCDECHIRVENDKIDCPGV